jgi:hypothetical protein
MNVFDVFKSVCKNVQVRAAKYKFVFLGFIAFAIVSRFAVFFGFSKAVFFMFLERILS